MNLTAQSILSSILLHFPTALCAAQYDSSQNETCKYLPSWMKDLKWRPTSPEALKTSENKLLSYLKSPYKGYYVNIGSGWGLKTNNIWTIEIDGPTNNSKTTNIESEEKAVPLVLIHGLGCGTGIWSLNYDSFAGNRKVFAFDILGFGRSSRPTFSTNETVEAEIVESIERWRKGVGLNDKFILLGHSFGGYLSLAYALKHPDHVSRLILADPWGIPSPESGPSTHPRIILPGWAKFLVRVFTQTFTPLSAIRGAGPWGPGLIQRARPDIKNKFEQLTGVNDSALILEYIYHANAQVPASGEIAFKTLTGRDAYAKMPMIDRVSQLSSKINLTFIFGSISWIDSEPGYQIKNMLPDHDVQINIIDGAGHHVYVDRLEEFNTLINKACKDVDDNYNTSEQ